MKTNGDSSKYVYGWFIESETQAETAYIDIFVNSAILNDIRNGSELSLDNPSFVQASFLRSTLVHELGHAVNFLGMLARENYEDDRVLSLSGKTSSKSEIRDFMELRLFGGVVFDEDEKTFLKARGDRIRNKVKTFSISSKTMLESISAGLKPISKKDLVEVKEEEKKVTQYGCQESLYCPDAA
jgi:hypothetical protein